MMARIALLLALLSLGLSFWSLREAALARAEIASISTDPGLQGVGEIMTGVHLHFAKMYSAARAANWPLATYEASEVAENVKRGARAGRLEADLPAFENVFDALATTCKDRGIARFEVAYRTTISACNQCHQRAGHPYIIVTVPSTPPVSNQRWAP